MIEWNEQQQMIQKMVRDFVAKEVVPNLDDIEYNGVPPYDILRKMIKTFGMDVMATQNYEKQIAREKAAAENGEDAPTKKKDGPSEGAGDLNCVYFPVGPVKSSFSCSTAKPVRT